MKIRILLLLLASASISQAQLFETSGLTGNRSFFGLTGNFFTVGASDVNLAALGFEDASGAGLTVSHDVGVFNLGGDLLASVTVPAGTTDGFVQGYLYVNLESPLTLSAGEEYLIEAVTTGGTDQFTDLDSGGGEGSTFTPDASISLPDPDLAFRYDSQTLVYPDMTGEASTLRWAPGNALFTPIPEPSSLAFLAVAASLFGARRRRK